MTFDTLQIQNFLSIKSVTLGLNNQGMVLICGENHDNADFQSNGAGKSSITEALAYVLYGRTIRGLKGDDVVNRVSKRNTKVMLDLTDDDGAHYRVARYRKHHQQGNKFYLFREGKDITPKSEADFTKVIGDLLQMDFFTFTSSILYSASSFKFSSATDSELKAAFDTLLGLDLYAACQDQAKAHLRDAESTKQALEAKVGMLESGIQKLTGDIQEATEQSQEWEQSQVEQVAQYQRQIDDLKAEQKDLLAQKRDKAAEVEQVQEGVSAAQAKVNKLKKTADAVEQLEDAIEQCQGMLTRHQRENDRIDSKMQAADREIKQLQTFIQRLEAKRDKLEIKRIDTESTVGSPCPTCGAPLTEASIEDALKAIQSEIDEIDEEISVHNEGIQQQNDIKARLKIEQKDLSGKVEAVEDDLATYQKLYDKSKGVMSKQQVAMEALSDAKLVLSRAEAAVDKLETQSQGIDRQIRSIKQSIEDTKSQENPFEQYIKKYTTQMEQQKETLTAVKAEADELDDTITCLRFWVKAYGNSGIKSLLLDDITPYLNRQANKFLHKLSSDHMEIRFSTQSKLKSGDMREKFSVEVVNTDGGASYAANSSGEKKRVDLAINLALQSLVASRSSKRLNVVMMDEVFDALDGAGIQKVNELLQELSTTVSSVFVISHNPELQGMFDNRLTVVKKGGYSTLKGTAVEEDADGNS